MIKKRCPDCPFIDSTISDYSVAPPRSKTQARNMPSTRTATSLPVPATTRNWNTIEKVAKTNNLLKNSVELTQAGFSELKMIAIQELAMGSNSKITSNSTPGRG